ncbi:MAG: sugar-transfer associated ATP-grasp domain-containing protein [Xanthomonadales bacterium]|jgi:hypothetical protein|nr:sugar-transfer associated ATP-grasp domain-containing protein [Xanthomonadales bacterium]
MKGKDLFDRFGIQPNVRQSGSLELYLRCQVHFVRALFAELRSKTGLHWKQRLKAWKAGFSSHSWMLYELDRKDPGLYLADLRAVRRGYRVNGFYNPVLGNKLLLSRLLSAHGIPHPGVVSILLEGRLYEENSHLDPDMPRALARSLHRHPRQVFRPVLSGNGEGVFFLDRDDDGLFLNGKRTALEDVCALLMGLDRYLSTEFQEQAPYARRIYAGSTNTLRILTLWDEKSGKPFIAATVHRFGSSRSGPTDHWHRGRGGVCASVDLETATMGLAASQSADNRLIWTASHPDSGEPIEGVVVPGLERCASGVLEAAACFPFCPSIGWDVVLTGDGFSIIEANTMQGLSVMQVHEPLLRDPRTRAFYSRHGMV